MSLHACRPRKTSGAGVTDDGGNVPTESEADEDHVERPKLSYKKKNKKRSSRSSRPAADAGSDVDGSPYTLNALHGGSIHVGSAVVVGDAEGVGGGGNQDSVYNTTHGKDSWEDFDNEEEYERPKLSYRGGGLQSTFATAPGSSSR